MVAYFYCYSNHYLSIPIYFLKNILSILISKNTYYINYIIFYLLLNYYNHIIKFFFLIKYFRLNTYNNILYMNITP